MTTRLRTARRPQVRAGGAARRTAWDDELVNTVVVNGGTTVAIRLMNNVADAEKRGCTVVRMIMGVDLLAEPPGVVSSTQRFTMGVGMISDDAFAGSVFPDPDTDSDFPVNGWMHRSVHSIRDELLATGVIATVRVDRDIRSQRKVERSTLALFVQNTNTEGAGNSIRITGLVRVLYKLP